MFEQLSVTSDPMDLFLVDFEQLWRIDWLSQTWGGGGGYMQLPSMSLKGPIILARFVPLDLFMLGQKERNNR